MSFNINLGAWGSVFAVPSQVVDDGLKLSSAYQLKVLLYILRNSGKTFTNEEIGQALGMHEADVKDAIFYWIDKGLLAENNNEIIPVQSENTVSKITETPQEKVSDTKENVKPAELKSDNKFATKPNMPRPQKPTHAHIAQLVCHDKTLVDLLNEVQSILGKTLSNTDTATIVYLYETCGLPAPVIMMLVEYCICIDKPNLRTIERIGIQWSDAGIMTVQAADERIANARSSYNNFTRVANVFGIHIAGTPSAKQLSYADRWINEWKFSDEMLREAYERCLNTKGDMKLSYIDGILKRWYNESIFNLAEIPTKKTPTSTTSRAKLGHPSSKSSYDIDELENRSFFD